MSEETLDAYEGREIRVCHKRGRITSANPQSYSVEIELGGVVNTVAVSVPFVHGRLGCLNEGCVQPNRPRSSYCSTECRDEDRGHTVDELLDPDADPDEIHN